MEDSSNVQMNGSDLLRASLAMRNFEVFVRSVLQ